MGKLLILLVLIISLNVPAVELQPGKEFYTIQIASFKKKEIALKVLNRIKNLPYARITHQNGRFRVRVGFFKSLGEAEQFANTELKSKINSFYITKTVYSSENVTFASDLEKNNRKEETSKISLKKLLQETKTPETTNGTAENVKRKTQEKKEQKTPQLSNHTNSTATRTADLTDTSKHKPVEEVPKKPSKLQANPSTHIQKKVPIFKYQEKQNPVREKQNLEQKNTFIFLSSATLLIIALFLIKLFKKRKKDSEENLEKFVSRLLEEGRCEEILETLLPLLTLQPDNTFIRKAVADCYVKSGKFLEAASIYEEIGEIFEKRGLQVLSDEFKRKAEELYEKEFKGGKKPSR